jgi:hypothetical protein
MLSGMSDGEFERGGRALDRLIPVALVNKTVAELMWTLTFIPPFVAGKVVMRAEARDAAATG